MAVRSIVRFPDARLRQPALAVTQFDDQLRALVEDLYDTMRAAPGVGITAPHIGVAQRVTVIQLSDAEPRRVYINPEILSSSAETLRHMEGSVSMPGVTDEVERPARVELRYQDVEGRQQSEAAEGFLAICIQHEIDQLDGIFWLQRLSALRRERLIKKYQKLQKRS